MSTRCRLAACRSDAPRPTATSTPLEECYRLYGPMVRGYLRHFVAGEEVDDLLQIVFLEVWRSRDRVDADRPFEAWLFGIARKRAIDQLRRRHHEVVSVDAIRELSGEDGDEFVERLAWAARSPFGPDTALRRSAGGDRVVLFRGSDPAADCQPSWAFPSAR